MKDQNYSDGLLNKALELLGYRKPYIDNDALQIYDDFEFNVKFMRYYSAGARWFLINYQYSNAKKHWVCIRINNNNTFQYIDSQLSNSISMDYTNLTDLIQKVKLQLNNAKTRRNDIHTMHPHLAPIEHIIIVPYCKDDRVKID
jgi:hypothetical protein